ncbi:peptidoglycan DD-metalloendopeptidase family protein [Marinoscillum luteum]|uniref:Peptidoglycan DD-metalloendopeptidase family protein n=1 Tax=Marinoscillum luteum TaxID=861051 RepID=A0ABW7NA82_9BACT
MADWLFYILKVSAFQAVLVLFYLLFLRGLTFYQFNRIFLLGILVIGFALPFVQVGSAPVVQANQELVTMIGTRISQSSAAMTEGVIVPGFQVSWIWLLSSLYAIGVLLLFQRYFSNFYKIRKFKYGYQLIAKIGAIEVFRTPFAQPFSFFRSVFIPEKVEHTRELNLVMAHELQHVNFGHSYDRMLADFIVVLFWFNPFIYLLRKSLIEVHEYQVDAAVTADSGVKIPYQMSLVSLAGGGFSGPVSFFNFSTIKKRIQMMNRNKSNKISLMSLVLLAPVIGGMVMLFSFEMKTPEMVFIQDNPSPALEGLVLPVEGAWVETPSIFPLGVKDEKVRVTSNFGYRTDPFDEAQKFHQGIDISAAEGTPVIATADGKVILVSDQPGGYGKHIVLAHDEVYQTKYAQLSSMEVKEGETVKRGQLIGRVGSSGRSTAPHLHYEVYKDGKAVNPVNYIADYQFAIQKQQQAEEKQRMAELKRQEAEEKQKVAEVKQRAAAEAQKAAMQEQELAEVRRAQAEARQQAIEKPETVVKLKSKEKPKVKEKSKAKSKPKEKEKDK